MTDRERAARKAIAALNELLLADDLWEEDARKIRSLLSQLQTYVR